MPYSRELIQDTLDFWDPRYAEIGEKLTEQYAIEILDNLIGYVKLLAEMDKKILFMDYISKKILN